MNKTQEKSASGKELKRMSAKEIRKRVFSIFKYMAGQYIKAMKENLEFQGVVEYYYGAYLQHKWVVEEIGVEASEIDKINDQVNQATEEFDRRRKNAYNQDNQ